MLDNIKKINIHSEPIPFIVINYPVTMSEYDMLYEQWNNLNHKVWKNFIEKYQIEVKQKNKLKAIAHRNQKEFVGYWFFQQRSDKRSVYVSINDKKVEYKANCLLILDSIQTFSVINKSSAMPEMLNCIVYFNQQQQFKIKESLNL